MVHDGKVEISNSGDNGENGGHEDQTNLHTKQVNMKENHVIILTHVTG